MARTKAVPDSKQEEKVLPSAGMEEKEIPTTEQAGRAVPPSGIQENMVMIGGKRVEIRPTLLKYMRNRTAEFYRVLDVYPLTDILATKAGV
ncbi:MAG: hypothetical protein Q4E13_12295 [Clostridia bacterium]|nr:hypothetical protein [Clostridia bacterium]